MNSAMLKRFDQRTIPSQGLVRAEIWDQQRAGNIRLLVFDQRPTPSQGLVRTNKGPEIYDSFS